jgi:hypothetical protein
VKTLPFLFGSWTTRTLQTSFTSSDSGSRFRFELLLALLVWPMAGRRVAPEGWWGSLGKKSWFGGNIREEVRNVGMSTKWVSLSVSGFFFFFRDLSFWV